VTSPLSVKRNNYQDNPKKSDIPTPPVVCEFLHELITNNYRITSILDPSCGDGNLTRPFSNVQTIQFDIKIGSDFLKCDRHLDIDLVLCNPPFNLGSGKRLGSEVFMDHICGVVGYETPIVLFTPMGFRLNQRVKSKRWRKVRDEYPPLTSILSLPLDIFDGVEFHNEVLFFNTHRLQPHYYLNI